MNKIRYNHLNSYLKNKFGSRTLKICVDGGFTCPNRDGSKGNSGCIFCSPLGSGELIKNRYSGVQSIKCQIDSFLNSYRGERANKFIVYFQSFSGTYDSTENLKQKYDIALSASDKIVGLQVATRPDCIDENVVSLLKSYCKDYYVCVELGLQTANYEIGEFINRKYTTDDFVKAVRLLKENGISVVAHLMVGLPKESEKDILDTVRVINDSGCDGIKIHSTYVLKNTKLESLYLQKLYTPITREEYVDKVVKIISALRKDIIIHRITAEPPKESLVCPQFVLNKKPTLNAINKTLEERDICQGDLYKPNSL